MLTFAARLAGLAETEATLDGLSQLGGILHTLLLARAHEGALRLARATNRRSGHAAAAWHVVQLDAAHVAIVNDAFSVRGYSYPTGLIAGTGARAVATTGYSGGHNTARPGMFPSHTLHPAWERELTIGFSLPSTLLGP